MVPRLALVLAVVTIAGGHVLERVFAVELGTPAPPFLGTWGLHLHPLAALAVPLLVVLAHGAPRLLHAPAALFAAAATALALGARLALSTVRDGPTGWWEEFDPARSFEAKNEYLPALDALTYGPRFFLDRFAELVPALPVHSAGHPPGLLLTMEALGITSPQGFAALCLLGGTLAVPLTLPLARALLPGRETAARVAVLLLALSPSALDMGATSADALYATLGVLAAWLLLTRPLLGALALAVCALFSWALLGVGAFAVLVVALRDGPAPAARTAALAGVVLVAAGAALHAATGYDPIGTLRATAAVYDNSVASVRPYWYWVLGSPVAWGVTLGLPIAYYALRARNAVALALLAVVVVSALGGFTKAETERIWQQYVPLACVVAASALPPGRLRLVLVLLAAQAVVQEVVIDLVW